MYINPKWIIVDFLRNRLTDPRARAEDTYTESFTATASQTEFSLTAPSGSVACITGVTDNGSAVNKWQDYYIDIQNEKVIFFNGRTLGHTIEITFKYGSTNWIFPDKPNTKLSAISFPRMNIMVVSGTGTRLGNYEAVVESNIQFQIDIWTKEKSNNQIFTINGNKYTGETLANYLAYQISKAFEDNESELFPALYNYNPIQIPRDLPFNVEYQAHHKTVEFTINGTEIGRVE